MVMTRRTDTRRRQQRSSRIVRFVTVHLLFSRLEEAGIVNKRSVLTTALVVAAGAFFAPIYAQDAAGSTNYVVA